MLSALRPLSAQSYVKMSIMTSGRKFQTDSLSTLSDFLPKIIRRWYKSFPHGQPVSLTCNRSQAGTSEASTKRCSRGRDGAEAKVSRPVSASGGSTSHSDSARACLQETAHHAQIKYEGLHGNSSTTIPAIACLDPDAGSAKMHEAETDRVSSCDRRPSSCFGSGFGSDHSLNGAMNAALQQQEEETALYDDGNYESSGASTMNC